MTPLETYLFLFTDAFVTGMVFPVRKELVFPAMLIFGGYNMYLAIIFSSVAITIAGFANWWIGRALRSLKKGTGTNSRFVSIISYFSKYGHLAALFSFIPMLGPVIVVGTGLVQANCKKTLIIVFTVNILWHLAWILTYNH